MSMMLRVPRSAVIAEGHEADGWLGREPGTNRGNGPHGSVVQALAHHIHIQVPTDHQAQRRAPDNGRRADVGQHLVQLEVPIYALRFGSQRVLLPQHPGYVHASTLGSGDMRLRS